MSQKYISENLKNNISHFYPYCASDGQLTVRHYASTTCTFLCM